MTFPKADYIAPSPALKTFSAHAESREAVAGRIDSAYFPAQRQWRVVKGYHTWFWSRIWGFESSRANQPAGLAAGIAAAMTTILDTKGLSCPLPVLRARKALRGLPPGGLLCVLATDPAAVGDFRAFCVETGHGFVDDTEPEPGVFEITVRKKG